MNVKLTVNQEHNGLELYFEDKPGDDVLTALKEARWRYHRAKKCWYAKQTPANLSIAQRFANPDGVGSSIEPSEEEGFFPPYNAVKGRPIHRSSDLSCWTNHEGYFQDIQAYISVRHDRIDITDLRNALTPGKTCEKLSLDQSRKHDAFTLMSGLETFRDVYDRYFIRREFPDCEVYTYESKSMKVFTPFKQIKPIRTPEKWTIPHVWKAILSGQIYYGVCDQYLTDDYAYDAASNFRSGVEKHLPSFACDLIESPSGWYVFVGKDDNGVQELSVNCHSFDLNTFLYDPACTLAENERRRAQRNSELEQHNTSMEARVMSSEAVREAMSDGLLFDVETLEMNDNTKRYETRSMVLLRSQIFSDDDCLDYRIMQISRHPIADADLFELGCNAVLKHDQRIMVADDQYVVTGKALQELLIDETTKQSISAVRTRKQTIAQYRATLTDGYTGRVQRLFNPTPQADYELALWRLEQEEGRAYGKLQLPQPSSCIKDWYEQRYPTDELGHDIAPALTFMGLFEAMEAYQSVYKTLGVSDSLVRERVFQGLAAVSGMSYDEIYEQWMRCNE